MFFFSSRRRHTRCALGTGVDVCSSDLASVPGHRGPTQIFKRVRRNAGPENRRIKCTAGTATKPSGRTSRRQIGRASCRERGCQYGEVWVVAEALKKNTERTNDHHNIKSHRSTYERQQTTKRNKM